ncbi:hypothetical protein [Motiliproteus coralliicola]|nr:hypothetical protein [Motiliproteus coralliicola]
MAALSAISHRSNSHFTQTLQNPYWFLTETGCPSLYRVSSNIAVSINPRESKNMNRIRISTTFKQRFRSVALAASLVLIMVDASFADGVSRKRIVSGPQGTSIHKTRSMVSEKGAARVDRRVTSSDSGAARYSRSVARSDGEGNSYRRKTKAISTADGGQGYKVTQSYRAEDGSRYRSTNKSVEGANGGSFESSKETYLNETGELGHSRTLSGQTADGKSYQTTLNAENGVVTRSSSCTDAAGNSIDCR